MENERIKLYQEFINVMTEAMQLTKQIKPNLKMQNALGKKLQVLGLQMMVISTDSVATNYLRWRTVAMDGSNPRATFNSFANLVVSMRKELLGETEVNRDHIMDSLT